MIVSCKTHPAFRDVGRGGVGDRREAPLRPQHLPCDHRLQDSDVKSADPSRDVQDADRASQVGGSVASRARGEGRLLLRVGAGFRQGFSWCWPGPGEQEPWEQQKQRVKFERNRMYRVWSEWVTQC